MANNKTGFDYYNIDTDRYQDMRIKRLKKDFGCTGIAVYDYLLCEIYRVKGCFIMWDENTAFDVSDYFGIKESAVLEIVKYCGHVGLFNKELLSRGVISSSSIQRRYQDMCKRAKRSVIEIPEECRIIPEESAKPPEEYGQTSGDLQQSKVEYSRVKESKVCMPPDKPAAHPPEVQEKYKAFCDWIEKHAPRVNKMKEPITIDQFITIKEKMANTIVTELLLQMHNWEPLLKKNRSAYLTLSNWYSRRDEVKRPLQKDELDDYKAKREKELARAKQINEGNL